MKTFNRLKWFLLIPFLGITILVFYIYFKNRWGKIIPTIKYFLYLFLHGLTFFIGFVVFALCFRLVNMLIDIKLEEYLYLLLYIDFILSYYLTVIPCYIFSKKFFVKMDEYNEMQNECNEHSENS